MEKALNKYIPDKDIIKSMCVQNKKLIKEINILEEEHITKNNLINTLKNKINALLIYKDILEEIKGEDEADTKAIARNIEYVKRLRNDYDIVCKSRSRLKQDVKVLTDKIIQLKIKLNS